MNAVKYTQHTKALVESVEDNNNSKLHKLLNKQQAGLAVMLKPHIQKMLGSNLS